MLVAQSSLTLLEPMDSSPPDSSVHGILQVRILEWVVIRFSRGSSNPGIELGSPVLQTDSLPPEPMVHKTTALTLELWLNRDTLALSWPCSVFRASVLSLLVWRLCSWFS